MTFYAYGWYNQRPIDLKDHRSKARGKGATGLDENKIYFYHGDHLGSASYVTDLLGDVFEHMLYLPYGETWVDEGSNTHLLGYRFTGKEEDSETKLIYFGARYYDARVSNWLSTDPALGEYLPTGKQLNNNETDIRNWVENKYKLINLDSKNIEIYEKLYLMDIDRYKKIKSQGGVFNSVNLNLYSYASLNPVTFYDPDGRVSREVKINYINDIVNYVSEVTNRYTPTELDDSTIEKINIYAERTANSVRQERIDRRIPLNAKAAEAEKIAVEETVKKIYSGNINSPRQATLLKQEALNNLAKKLGLILKSYRDD